MVAVLAIAVILQVGFSQRMDCRFEGERNFVLGLRQLLSYSRCVESLSLFLKLYALQLNKRIITRYYAGKFSILNCCFAQSVVECSVYTNYNQYL